MVTTTCLVYRPGSGIANDVPLAQALAAIGEPGAIVWIDVLDPDEASFAPIAASLALHPLTVEDVLNPDGRPKVEDLGNHVLVIFKALNFNPGEQLLDAINLNAIVHVETLVTVRAKPVRSVQTIRDELARRPAGMERGPAFLLYRILDNVLELYQPLFEEIEVAIEELEERIFGRGGEDPTTEIYERKAQVTHLRRRTGPQRELLMVLSHRPHLTIAPDLQVYFRDLHDQATRMHDHLESYRDLLQGALDTHMSRMSNQMSQVMKVLSLVATILLPLTLLTGLYGTNFYFLPGAGHHAGFWVFSGALAAIGLSTVLYFKVKRWF